MHVPAAFCDAGVFHATFHAVVFSCMPELRWKVIEEVALVGQLRRACTCPGNGNEYCSLGGS